MRFRFCWDVDCPDWLLAEITTMAKMTSIKLRLLCTQVAKSISTYPNQPIQYENVTKLTSDAKLDIAGTKAVVAAVHWILESAAGSDTEGNVLDSELQQLGLPKEHATGLTKVYSEHQQNIRQSLGDKSLKVGKGTTWDCEVKGVPSCSKLLPVVQLIMNKDGQTDSEKEIFLSTEQLDALIQELTEARQKMEELN